MSKNSHDFRTATRLEKRPFYKWLTELPKPFLNLNEAMSVYLEVPVTELPSEINGRQFNQLQQIFTAFWRWKTTQDMEPQFLKPGYVDASGSPTSPAPRPNGDGYAQFVLWKRRDADEHTKTTGRVNPIELRVDNPSKFDRHRRLATGGADASWGTIPPEKIEEFLQRIYEDKDLRLVFVLQSKEVGDIQPQFIFVFTDRKHVRRKHRQAPARRKLAAPSDNS